MTSYVITGTSRGIGLELVKQLLEKPPSSVAKIFAITRNTNSPGLSVLVCAHPDRLVNIVAEVQREDSVKKAAAEVESRLGVSGVDVLINNAGTLSHDSPQVEDVSSDLLREVFDVNVVAVNQVSAAFLPLLQKGKKKQVFNLLRNWPPSPVNAYRISKAGLNMLTALYAHEKAAEGFTFVLISPGWLMTDLGSSWADLEVEVGTKEVVRITEQVTPEQNGQFLNIHVPGWEDKMPALYDGKQVPW
ncbi:hypothetical protein PRZ48_012222 [Zasmidium cellare]|uniref:Uncharacterized protein n=1 Tax=Zasmidium cellare TaxID=395010 RepID=A0ABR0E485_ZASCE|nr:hypothetical protein PRZ48_012222 [Zasmidium cellare]